MSNIYLILLYGVHRVPNKHQISNRYNLYQHIHECSVYPFSNFEKMMPYFNTTVRINYNWIT